MMLDNFNQGEGVLEVLRRQSVPINTNGCYNKLKRLCRESCDMCLVGCDDSDCTPMTR